MGVNYLTDKNDDGACVGQSSTDKIAFFGATPVVQQTAPSALSTASAATGSTKYGFSTSTQANAIATAVNSIRTVLNNLGLTA